MTLTRESVQLAHAEEMPGTRCDPEDEIWPCPYTVLTEPELSRELCAAAQAERIVLDARRGWRADVVTFQPCAYARSQDRHVVRHLDVHGKAWTLAAVFDGHLGEDTVEHTAYHLPIIIEDFLRKAVSPARTNAPDPHLVADVLRRAISSFDAAIAKDVLELFPGGLDAISQYSNEHIGNVINDGGENWKKTRLCMYGTTALVSLVCPDHDNLWVANLGDCQGVLVTSDENGRRSAEILTAVHNGDNRKEVDRIRREHPGESEAIMDGRVLGVIAPSRCIGDIPFKQPPEFTRSILYNLHPGHHASSPWEEFLVRNHTPPYISADADVVYRRLDHSSHTLILCTDGLTDMCHHLSTHEMVHDWAFALATDSTPPSAKGAAAAQLLEGADNLAVRLLRHVLGGEDVRRVSQALMLNSDIPWVDDTTCIVQTL